MRTDVKSDNSLHTRVTEQIQSFTICAQSKTRYRCALVTHIVWICPVIDTARTCVRFPWSSRVTTRVHTLNIRLCLFCSCGDYTIFETTTTTTTFAMAHSLGHARSALKHTHAHTARKTLNCVNKYVIFIARTLTRPLYLQ